ncbi:MAG TPA: xanthine dehydrogenase family protein molybdopterin-binding subunit [Steroidobacteraceae bacterium]|nr:xanthine dehydrogenase family protein molybdopterin-binding subunit [Steroidobacteraceae bacterium]
MTQVLADLTRRGFLSGAAGVGGTVVLALTLPGFGGKEKPGAAAGGQLNAWLTISADNSFTVIVDRSEMGQGVYTALPMLLAEELEISVDAIKVVAAPVGDAYVNPLNGGQVTGTSNSVQDAWEKLRMAGAQARTMLIVAAAERWRVDPNTCHVENGLIHGPAGKTLSYGAVAAAAAKVPVPKDVKLKPKERFRIIGKSRLRIDSASKVDGSAEFGIDVKLPGMLHGALAQSPVLGGKVAMLDAAVAESMPGVRKVLVTTSGVVVVADHFWQAIQARKALKITWEPGSNARLDNIGIRALLEKAAKADPGSSARADGDAAAALKSAKQSPRAVYELPLLAHATMEPMNCTADVKPDGCDIFVGTQVQQMAQATAAAAAGLDPGKVRVFTTLLGGGFGRRLDVDFIPAAVEASKAMGAPVKVIWTREDDMTHDTYRPPAREEVSGGLDAQGRLTAWSLHITSPSITARASPSTTDPFDSVVEYAVNYPYAVPNFSLTYTRQEIGIDVGYMRSVSHAPNCFVIESFMDELAVAAGKDPVEFRLSLLEAKPRHRRVLQTAAQRAGWGRPVQGRFRGVALMEGYTTHVAQVAEISVDEGVLKVHKITCVVDCGQMVNPRIVESQIESGIVFGLSAALWGEVTIMEGQVQQTNFNSYRVVRGNEMPELDVLLLESGEAPGGIGEPSVALVAPAICNAIFAATGNRLRALPIAGQNLSKA